MKKKVVTFHGKKYYLLGVNANGEYQWLEEAKFDCDWYWGFGYVESFTNNKHPELAKDISAHTHFDSLFFRRNKNAFNAFKEYYADCTVNDNELWKLCELMKEFYIAREYSDMLYRGGANYTKSPLQELIVGDTKEYDRINKVIIPKICEEIYKLLGA